MATIKFLIQKKTETANIYVRLSAGRKVDIKAPTNYVINAKDWSTAKGKPKPSNLVNIKALDNDLDKLRTRILNYYNDSVNTGKTINTDWLKECLNPKDVINSISESLIDHFDYYIKAIATSTESSTHAKYTVVKHLVKRFQDYKKTTYLIRDVNNNFKSQFEDYCKNEKYGHNTIVRAINYIKTVCFNARKNYKIQTDDQLDDIVGKYKKSENVFLNPNELKQIEDADIHLEHLINARDWLIISCETGQRISDFMRFKKEMIRYEGEVPLIEFTQKKTGKIMTVPINDKVNKILNSRNGEFPVKMSDQRYNDHIKRVCEIAKLDNVIYGSKTFSENKKSRKVSGYYPKHELITAHIGRRSFATNYYGLIPTSLLIYITGHSTEKQFLEYICKSATESAIQIADYFKRIK